MNDDDVVCDDKGVRRGFGAFVLFDVRRRGGYYVFIYGVWFR